MSTRLMGRPKKKPNAGQPPTEFRNLTVRASTEWLDWVERGAAHCRMNMATSVDVALSEFFRAHGFEEMPPPRY